MLSKKNYFFIDELFKTEDTFEDVEHAFEQAKESIQKKINGLNKRTSMIDFERKEKSDILGKYLGAFKELEERIKKGDVSNNDLIAFKRPTLSEKDEDALAKSRGFRGSFFAADLVSQAESFALTKNFSEIALKYFKYTLLKHYKNKCKAFFKAIDEDDKLPAFPELSLAQTHLLGHKSEQHMISFKKDILDVYTNARIKMKETASKKILEKYNGKSNGLVNTYENKDAEFHILEYPFLTKNEVFALTNQDLTTYINALKKLCQKIFLDSKLSAGDRKHNYFTVIGDPKAIFLWHVDYIISAANMNAASLGYIGTIGMGIQQILLKNNQLDFNDYIEFCAALFETPLERSFPKESFLTLFCLIKQDKVLSTSIEKTKDLIELKNASEATLDDKLKNDLYKIGINYRKHLRNLVFLYNLKEGESYVSDTKKLQAYIQEEAKKVQHKLSSEKLNGGMEALQTQLKEIIIKHIEQKCLLLFKTIETELKKWEETNLITVAQTVNKSTKEPKSLWIIEDYFILPRSESKPKEKKLVEFNQEQFKRELEKMKGYTLNEIRASLSKEDVPIQQLFKQIIENYFSGLKKTGSKGNASKETFEKNSDEHESKMIMLCANELKKINIEDFFVSIYEFNDALSSIYASLDMIHENNPGIERVKIAL